MVERRVQRAVRRVVRGDGLDLRVAADVNVAVTSGGSGRTRSRQTVVVSQQAGSPRRSGPRTRDAHATVQHGTEQHGTDQHDPTTPHDDPEEQT